MIDLLLKYASRNKHLGGEYDQAIEECGEAAGLRNEYVHGRWWTSEKGSLVTFAPSDKYGLEFLNSEPITSAELNYVLYRIRRAAVLVTRLTVVPANKRASLQAIPPLEPMPKNMKARHRIDARENEPQPQPSKAPPRMSKGQRNKDRKAKAAAHAKQPPAKPKPKK